MDLSWTLVWWIFSCSDENSCYVYKSFFFYFNQANIVHTALPHILKSTVGVKVNLKFTIWKFQYSHIMKMYRLNKSVIHHPKLCHFYFYDILMRSTKFPHSDFRSFLCLITIMPKSASLNFLYSLKIPTHCCFDLTHTTPYPPKEKKTE